MIPEATLANGGKAGKGSLDLLEALTLSLGLISTTDTDTEN